MFGFGLQWRQAEEFAMESNLISNVGFFWREDHVFWGAGSSAGNLLGVPAKNVTANNAIVITMVNRLLLTALAEKPRQRQFKGWE